MKAEKIVVSVWMTTYNHEKYIAQAIESVLMQKTDFPIELVIGEDKSTDNTAAIVKEYADKYPEIIRARFNNPNLGMMPNMIKTLDECTGKYIALCEGDDYWTDPYKLQKQVNILEENPEYGLVYTDKIEVDENNSIIHERPFYKIQEKRYDSGELFFSLLKGNFVNTFTVLLKKDKLPVVDRLYSKFYYDWYYWLYISMFSKIYFLNEETGAYRIHQDGYIQSLKKSSQAEKAHIYRNNYIKLIILHLLPYSYKFKIKKKEYLIAIKEYIKLLIKDCDLSCFEKKKLLKSFLYFIVKYNKSLVS